MGLFSGVKEMFRRTEAATVLTTVFDHLNKAMGYEAVKSSELAATLVGSLWKAAPDLVSAQAEVRPSRHSLAVASLSLALETLPSGHAMIPPLVMALGLLLKDLEKNGWQYGLNHVDMRLIENSVEVYATVSQELASSPLSRELAALTGAG
jgi:hypothetical protein